VQVTDPEGWTDADTQRLIALCSPKFAEGCVNPSP
jgi:hypothetical protein